MRSRVSNFGDLLSPTIVGAMLEHHKIDEDRPQAPARLLTVGSVMHLARDGNVIWGSGVNGHHLRNPPASRSLDVRAVRGPLSREYLRAIGIDAPDVYGDPGLLLGRARPDLLNLKRRHAVTVCMNINDSAPGSVLELPSGVTVLDPTSPLEQCLRTIAESELVVGSALHAIVVAESLGVGARLVAPLGEPLFKYRDYLEGTGRRYAAAMDFASAIDIGAEDPPEWDEDRLVSAFPTDLWRPADAE